MQALTIKRRNKEIEGNEKEKLFIFLYTKFNEGHLNENKFFVFIFASDSSPFIFNR